MFATQSSKALFYAVLTVSLFSISFADQIGFEPCTEETFGLVSNVDITPCERGASDEPCRFRFGQDYAITGEYEMSLAGYRGHGLIDIPTVEYTPLISADAPKATLEARDDSVQPSKRYPYSGQSFDGESCSWLILPFASH